MYGSEMVALKKTESRAEGARNKYIRETNQVVVRVRGTRLRSVGHIQRRDSGYIGQGSFQA